MRACRVVHAPMSPTPERSSTRPAVPIKPNPSTILSAGALQGRGMVLNCGDPVDHAAGEDGFEGGVGCPAVVALGRGDVGVPGESADVDRGVAQGGHDVWPGSGADGRVVLTERDIADPVQSVLYLPVAT